MGGFRSRNSKYTDEGHRNVDMKRIVKEPMVVVVADHHLLAIFEPSMLVSNGLRDAVYASLPVVLHSRKWLLLYSTSKHEWEEREKSRWNFREKPNL
ncbi:uncharacterized protein HKW66_Vig0125250 [Vigna angularis]|uniref:Uncharacterized protein n=1 Tax=Phaseolus angularis TaxID=3914 RepID=A0A8T0K3M1_PHAAN|nr:uncharacterized protein HKW66_Vig0125250 [Vigna angularis]